MSEKLKKGDKIYVVCDDNPRLTPNNVLGSFKNKNDAYKYIGKYVVELNKYTSTGYIKVLEMSIGEPEKTLNLGMENY